MEAVLVVAALIALESSWAKFGLADPVRLKSGDSYVDSDHGHAHPMVQDMDSDGVPDLVVGQFEGGKARIYWNKGTAVAPRFEGHTWFQAGGTDGKVPFG